METEDREAIDKAIGKVEDMGENWEGEIWLSTDGKNTVRVLAKTSEGRVKSAIWAKKMFEAIKERYGTKQAQAVREYKKPPAAALRNTGTIAPAKTKDCDTCNGTRTLRSGISKKNNKPWKAWMCSNQECQPQWVR